LFVATLAQSFATEKYAIASDASAVIVGEFSDVRRRPSLDGWVVTGKIRVVAKLYSKFPLPQSLDFHFVCSCCQLWPPPDTTFLTTAAGHWFLVPRPNGVWTSVGSCADPGLRPIHEREEFEQFFKGRVR
jgi:hypothetical protein